MSKNHQNEQVTAAETVEIMRLAEQCLEVTGDFVELGCYRGDTSVLLGKLLKEKSRAQPVENLCKTSKIQWKNPTKSVEKRLWIYDSFAGLPEKTQNDQSGAGESFRAGELAVTKREVVDKLRRHGLVDVRVKKAWFDQLGATDLPTTIAFAFLDGDLYSSIKTSFELVVPRMAKAGIIVVHDYNRPELPGATRAVDEFLCQHSEYWLKVYHSLAILQTKT